MDSMPRIKMFIDPNVKQATKFLKEIGDLDPTIFNDLDFKPELPDWRNLLYQLFAYCERKNWAWSLDNNPYTRDSCASIGIVSVGQPWITHTLRDRASRPELALLGAINKALQVIGDVPN